MSKKNELIGNPQTGNSSLGAVSHSFFVGQKIPHLKYGYLKVMAYADGYYMARYKGCAPFCCTEKELIMRSINCG